MEARKSPGFRWFCFLYQPHAREAGIVSASRVANANPQVNQIWTTIPVGWWLCCCSHRIAAGWWEGWNGIWGMCHHSQLSELAECSCPCQRSSQGFWGPVCGLLAMGIIIVYRQNCLHTLLDSKIPSHSSGKLSDLCRVCHLRVVGEPEASCKILRKKSLIWGWIHKEVIKKKKKKKDRTV